MKGPGILKGILVAVIASLAAGKVVANYGPRLPAADYPALRMEFFGD